jgi:dGTPase
MGSLTWIMEACDDIAYSVLDVDDVMKKSIVSPDDTLAVLKAHRSLKEAEITGKIQASFEKAHDGDRRPEVVRDIKIGYLRAYLIEALIKEASATFVANAKTIMDLSHQKPLMDGSELCDTLKGVAQQYAFSNLRVLRTEAVGAAAIDGLMSFFWGAIRGRKDEANLTSKRTSARAKYGYALISPNYIEDAVRNANADGREGGLRYRELRLLTDMISGMTDTFAIKLWNDVRQVPDVGRD